MAGYRLSASQVAALGGAAVPRSEGVRSDALGGCYTVPGPMPGAFSQAMRGSCVANAVAALVEYSEGCRTRLSVQYLMEATRLVEDEWAERNLKMLREGKGAEADFAAAFPSPVRQVEMLVKANGAGSMASEGFVASFGRQVRKRLAADSGTRLKRTFEALSRYGICRYEIWPYARVALSEPSGVGDAAGEFPPRSHGDARRHRVAKGLYSLRAPNNVDEIKGLLRGARRSRPMPVCIGVELFEGCDGETFSIPRIRNGADGPETVEEPKGLHEILLFGYEDAPAAPGGGYFRFLNSWGVEWGDAGCGRIPYAYVECFCREAGTILRPRRSVWPAAAALLCISAVAAAAVAVHTGFLDINTLLDRNAGQHQDIEPQPTPDPIPDPTPDPIPDPTPDPKPDPTPDPQPDSMPDPIPDPTPTPPVLNLDHTPPKPIPSKPKPTRSDDDDTVVIERNLLEWRWRVSIELRTQKEAGKVLRALVSAKRSRFVFSPDAASDHAPTVVSGLMTIEAPKSDPPSPGEALKRQLKRKAPDVAVDPENVSIIREGVPSKGRRRQ